MSNVEVKHCGPRPHAGETLTVNFLQNRLPAGKILVNYYLPLNPDRRISDGTRYRNTAEIDVVVINSNGVYLIDVKHWAGVIEADQATWRQRGENRPNPVPKIKQREKQMSGFLADRSWSKISVVGLVVLSKGRDALRIDSDNPDGRWILGWGEDLVNALTGREYLFDSRCPKLTDQQVRTLSQTLFDSHIKDAERQVCGYRILSERECDDYVELIGEDLEVADRVRIKQYEIPYIGSQRELDTAADRFKREIKALRQAGRHPNLVLPYRFQRDENSDEWFYLISELASEETLANRLALGIISPDKQISILNDVAAALAHCHQHGIYHRNLSPTSIFLTPDGRAMVGDFDFAKVPAISRTLTLTRSRQLTGRHIAPEQMIHAPNVGHRADIFSLGVIWYDMVFQPEADDIPVDRTQIDMAPLSADGQVILKMMLAESPSERPQTMAEVQQWLNMLT